MLKKQNILYAPKISFKIPKKFPKFLEIHLNLKNLTLDFLI